MTLFKREKEHPSVKADPQAEGPNSQPAKPLAEGEKHDQLAKKAEKAEDRQEALLDEAIEETFPGSDPISPKHIT